MRLYRALAVAAAVLASACVSVDVGTEGRLQSQYRLDDLGTAPARRPAPIPRALLVSPVATGAAGESFALMFSKEPAQRSSYQFASWTDRPSARFAQLVVERLAAREAFESVALLGSGVGGDLLLNIAVADMFHDATTTPGNGTVEVRAELVERTTRRLVGRRTFKASVALDGEANAARAAAALTRATAQVLDELLPWVEQAAERAPSARR
jgi:ABC-type uncharacterized transport system auxiliary subunit